MTTVLIEASNPLTRLDLAEEFTAANYGVLTCSGQPDGRCPLLKGEACSLMDQADVVINALSDEQLEIHVAQQDGWPATPTLVLVEEWRADTLRDLGIPIETAPVTAGGFELMGRIRQLLRPSQEG